jgi:hypothetical protein
LSRQYLDFALRDRRKVPPATAPAPKLGQHAQRLRPEYPIATEALNGADVGAAAMTEAIAFRDATISGGSLCISRLHLHARDHEPGADREHFSFMLVQFFRRP